MTKNFISYSDSLFLLLQCQVSSLDRGNVQNVLEDEILKSVWISEGVKSGEWMGKPAKTNLINDESCSSGFSASSESSLQVKVGK